MKLIGNLKKQVENAKSKEEAKSLIEKAGMALNADELEMVTGGGAILLPPEGLNQEVNFDSSPRQ